MKCVEGSKLRLQDTGAVCSQLFAVINVFCIAFCVPFFVTKNKLLEENAEKAAWSAR